VCFCSVLPRGPVVSALSRRVEGVSDDVIANTVECFDYDQNGKVKYSALSECLLAPVEVGEG
jgi:hypothetical protein